METLAFNRFFMHPFEKLGAKLTGMECRAWDVRRPRHKEVRCPNRHLRHPRGHYGECSSASMGRTANRVSVEVTTFLLDDYMCMAWVRFINKKDKAGDQMSIGRG